MTMANKMPFSSVQFKDNSVYFYIVKFRRGMPVKGCHAFVVDFQK